MKKTTTKNLHDIMTRAWAIRRSASKQFNIPVSAVHMGECLRAAWSEAESVNAEQNAAAIIAEWQNMTETDQHTMMLRCVKRASRNYIGHSAADHYDMTVESPAFDLYGLALDEYINEGFCKLLSKLDLDYIAQQNERRAAKWLKPLTLVSLVYRAADAGIHQLIYREKKNGRSKVKTITDSKGNTYDYIDTMAASRKDNTENSAITAVMLAQFRDTRDDIDNAILDGLTAGATYRDIAAAVGITHQAVAKRVGKLRTALAAALSA